MISDMKRTSHHAVIITNYAIWHQSLKSIHYRILLIFQTKKNNRFEGQNMGGIKDMLSPPHVKTWGGYIPPHPPGIYALGLCRSEKQLRATYIGATTPIIQLSYVEIQELFR